MDIVKYLGRCRPQDVAGIGTVKFFDNTSTKQFGFLDSDQGDVYIHGTRAVELVAGSSDEPEMIKADVNPDDSLMHPPKRGDKVVFVAEKGPRGLRSIRWLFISEEELSIILAKISARPLYRLMRRKGHRIASGFPGDNIGRVSVQWEGKNVSEVKYTVYDNESGAIYFQIFNPITKEWEKCGDPR